MKSAQNFYQIDEGQNVKKLDGYLKDVCEWIRGGPRVKEDYLLVQVSARLGINRSLARRLIYYPQEIKKLSAAKLRQIEMKYLTEFDRRIEEMEKQTAELRVKRAAFEATLGKGNVCSDQSTTPSSKFANDDGGRLGAVVI